MCFPPVSRFTDLTPCRCKYGTVLEPASVCSIHPGVSTQIQGFGNDLPPIYKKIYMQQGYVMKRLVLGDSIHILLRVFSIAFNTI